MITLRRAAPGALLFILCAAGVAGGTTVERMSLKDIASRSARIAEVKIRAVSAARDRSNRPATRVTADVIMKIRGVETTTLEWLQPGGTVDGETLLIPGIPQFSAGEECILFLSDESKAGLAVPVGLGQGAFRERKDPKTGKIRVQADVSGLDLVDPATGKLVNNPPSSMDRELFIGEVARMVGK